MTAALTATISDQVPVAQRGFVSGWVSAPQAIGTVLGLVLLLYVITEPGARLHRARRAAARAGGPVPAADEGRGPDARAAPEADRGPCSPSMWVSPRKHPDFAWTLTSRILINLGNALGTTQLLYFLIYGLKVENPEDDLLLLSLVYMVFVVVRRARAAAGSATAGAAASRS